MTIYGMEWGNDDDRDECWSIPIILICKKSFFWNSLQYIIYMIIYIWPFYVLKPSSFLYTQTFHVWIPWPHDASDLTFDLKLESWDLWLEISGILGNLEKRHPIEIPKPLEIGCSFQVPGHIVEVGYPHIELWIEITRYFNSSIDIKSLFTYTLIQRHVAPFWWVEVS